MGKVKTNKLQQLCFCCLMFAAGCFASCSDQEDIVRNTPSKGETYEVSLNATIGEPVGNLAKGMTRVAVAEDATSGLKTTWENDDKLTVAYKSGGTLKTTELSVASINGSSATFHGSVESGADAQAFNTSTLYVVNNKATDKIDVSVSDGKMKVNVDLSGQNGTAANVANYDLLYAKGTASSSLQFSHKMCVMRMDFVPDASVETGHSISRASFIYVPTSSTDKSIFASKASFECGDDGISSSYSGVTFFSLNSLALPYINGKSSMYIVVPANDQLTGELSIKVKGDNENTFRRHLNIKGKSFPEQKVVAKTVKLKADELIPKIGDYLYSDGT